MNSVCDTALSAFFCTRKAHLQSESYIHSGDTKRGLAKAMFTVCVVAIRLKHPRNINCLNLVKPTFWRTLFGRP